jgi:hypothetical protein
MLMFFSAIIVSTITFSCTATLLQDETSGQKNTQAAKSKDRPSQQKSETPAKDGVVDAPTIAGAGAKTAEIDELVAQLDHERLTVRQKAQKKLLSLGKESIPALAKAALSGKRATIEKSIEVLGKLALSDDEEIKDGARVTLQMLSESDQPSTADRATLALNSKEADGIKPFEGWDKPGHEFAGGGQINRSVSVSSVNGVRSIRVKQNGRETTIQELSGGRIFVEVTGDDEPIEMTVKNAVELKKKLPEVAALYEQYASDKMPAFNFPGMGKGIIGAFNGANAQAFGNAIGPNQGFAFGGNGGGDVRQMVIKQLEELKERMKENPAMQAMIDQQIDSLK